MNRAGILVICCAGALLGLGMVTLYSAGMGYGGPKYLVNQAIWGVLGLCSAMACASLDYRMLKRLARPLFVLSVISLILVLEPHVGKRINGARRWFVLSHFSIQPSEFAKLALILILAWYGDKYQRQMGDFKKGLFRPGMLAAVILALIYVEPDRGTTILLAAITGVMLLVAGVRWRYIVPPFVLGGVALGISLWNDPMRFRRIFSWWFLEENKAGVGYQAYQAMLALGSGGLSGVGLGDGRQKLGFVPEHQTDFILSTIGEELGFIAAISVVVVFVMLVLAGLRIAWKARDMFGMLLATGITFLIGLQAMINIGVVTSALPNKGLPLPFISYGGSSLLIMMTCVGLLVSVARGARDEVFEHEDDEEAEQSAGGFSRAPAAS